MLFRKKISSALLIWLLSGAFPLFRAEATQNSEAPRPFGVYKVTPDSRGRFISIEADLKLQPGSVYLKDFGQLNHIQWFAGGKEIPVTAKRTKDTIAFSQLPTAGDVRAVYQLNCVTHPIPGYRKQLIGSSNFVLGREGLFIGIDGQENGLVDIRWALPSGWQLAVGNEGRQRFVDTQKTLWIAGIAKQSFENKIDGKIFKIAVHEMLHWWTNFQVPAWFREGVHTYLASKLLVKLGIIDASLFKTTLESFLQEHERVVKREGRLSTLAESSENYDRQRGGGDMYGLMPLLAYKLDREIQAQNPDAGLEQVFAAAAGKRLNKFDFLALIRDLTGYGPQPLFRKFFYAKVEDASELLK